MKEEDQFGSFHFPRFFLREQTKRDCILNSAATCWQTLAFQYFYVEIAWIRRQTSFASVRASGRNLSLQLPSDVTQSQLVRVGGPLGKSGKLLCPNRTNTMER